MITERVRRVMNIMATEQVVPAVRAVALRELTRMLGVAADGCDEVEAAAKGGE
jgi:hypothetical protein